MDIRIILSFVIPVIFMIVCIKKNVTSFLFLLGAAVLSALIGGMPLNNIVNTMSGGFGEIMQVSGLIIILGVVFAEILEASGGLSSLMNRIVTKTGSNGSIFAVWIFGYVLSIPVSFIAATAVGCPLLKGISDRTGKPLCAYGAAYISASWTTNFLVVPTFTPVMVAGMVGANIGTMFVCGLIVSLIASLIGSLAYAYYLAKRYGSVVKAEDFHEHVTITETQTDKAGPSGGTIVGLILVPIVLILLGSIIPYVFPAGSAIVTLFSLIGNASFAMILAVLAAMVALWKYIAEPMKAVERGIGKVGINLAVCGMANAFGAVLLANGIDDLIIRYTQNINIPVLVLAYVVTVLLRMGTGVNTVACTTVAPLFLPLVVSTGVSPVLYAMTICLGAAGFTIPTEPSFWIYKDFTKMTTKETTQAYTVPTTIISVVGFVIVLIMSSLGIF